MKNKRAGFKLGFGLIFTGVIFGVLNHVLLYYQNFTMELLLAYPVFVMWGLGLMLSPGADVKDLKTQEDIMKFLKESKPINYIVWVLSLVIGAAGCIWQMFYYGLE